jgi:hypothetical protein
MGWLGWALAGVLLLTAGGAALAAQDATTTTRDPGAKADRARARAQAAGPGLGRGWRHGLGGNVLHGEVTAQTRDGVKTLVVARGEVTALSGSGVTVKSSDGVSTSFRIDGDTRYGFRNEPAQQAALEVGDTALVTGEKSGDSAVARRVVSGELAERAGKRATP